METSNNYRKLKELISQDKILLLPHQKDRGISQMWVYTRCGMSQKYFTKAYNKGNVILQLGEIGPRVGYPVPWEQALNDFLNNK